MIVYCISDIACSGSRYMRVVGWVAGHRLPGHLYLTLQEDYAITGQWLFHLPFYTTSGSSYIDLPSRRSTVIMHLFTH